MIRMLLSITLLCSGSASLAAQPPASGLEALGRPLADAELAEHRGKFVSANGIHYFGLQLHTKWTDANGVTTAATLVFTLNFEGAAGDISSAVPILLAGYVRDDEQGLSATGEAVDLTSSAALATSAGAIQTLQIAGSKNNARNGMRIGIGPLGNIVKPDVAGLSPLGSSQSIDFADGDTIQFLVSPGEIGLLMTGGGGDQALQSFGGSVGQAGQHIYLASDRNSLSNDMHIVIGTDLSAATSHVSLNSSLMSLNGL